MTEATVAIIGGSGLYALEGLVDVSRIDIETPFGNPSDSLVLGKLGGVPVAFLPRHGRGHHLIPSEIPVRANIYALKLLGVERIISVSAVGSLREDVHPRDGASTTGLRTRYPSCSTSSRGSVTALISR